MAKGRGMVGDSQTEQGEPGGVPTAAPSPTEARKEALEACQGPGTFNYGWRWGLLSKREGSEVGVGDPRG